MRMARIRQRAGEDVRSLRESHGQALGSRPGHKKIHRLLRSHPSCHSPSQQACHVSDRLSSWEMFANGLHAQ